MKKMLVFFIAALLLVGCTTSDQSAEMTVTDPSKPIEVQAGETFTIVLASNPSTGYHWDFTGELDREIVEFVSNEYEAEEPAMPGSGGVDVWKFKAVSAGQTEITLGSFPPGADVTEPEETVTFTIIVK